MKNVTGKIFQGRFLAIHIEQRDAARERGGVTYLGMFPTPFSVQLFSWMSRSVFYSLIILKTYTTKRAT